MKGNEGEWRGMKRYEVAWMAMEGYGGAWMDTEGYEHRESNLKECSLYVEPNMYMETLFFCKEREDENQ